MASRVDTEVSIPAFACYVKLASMPGALPGGTDPARKTGTPRGAEWAVAPAVICGFVHYPSRHCDLLVNRPLWHPPDLRLQRHNLHGVAGSAAG